MKPSAVFALVLCLFSSPLVAQSTSATLWLSQQLNEESSGIDDDDPSLIAEIGSGSGYGLSVSRLFTPRLSGELSIFRISAEGEVRSPAILADLGDIELTPIAAMLRFHFLPGQRFDVYAGAGIAYVSIDDLDSDDLRGGGLAPIRVSSETTAVLGAGATFDFSDRWGIAADLRYIPLEISGRPAGDTESVTADLDPLIVSAGIRVRF